MSSLVKRFDRSQIDLEAVKTREKLLRDEHEKLKGVHTKEREMLRSKLLDFQQKLQQADQAADALARQLQRLETANQALETQLTGIRDTCAQAETRLRAQEAMTNRFLQEKLDAERVRDQCASQLAASRQDLTDQRARADELEAQSTRSQDQLDAREVQTQCESERACERRDCEIDALMHTTVDQARAIDELTAALASRDAETQALRADLERFQELQLSQDETVQALQLARLKTATNDALALVEDEKRALEAQIDALVRQNEQDARRFDERIAALDEQRVALETRVRELLEANRLLIEEKDVCEQQQLLSPPPASVVEVEVEVEVERPPAPVDSAERARLDAEMAQLQQDYAELQASFAGVEAEYKKLVTRKYKTESFQSQVRLLQHENSELTLRLEHVCTDLAKERADLNARTLEACELRTRVVDPSALELLRRTQEALEKTVSALVATEAASESAFTCLQCLQLFVEPVTLAPCGHTYCAHCVATFGDVEDPASLTCKDCAAAASRDERTTHTLEPPDAVFPNQALADLTARFLFRQQALSALATMCLSLRNSFANRSAPSD